MCGGAIAIQLFVRLLSGLSPRVRGSRSDAELRGRGAGSIPACAGEPTDSYDERQTDRVYPRVCGGARPGAHREAHWHGSIPACAGEPWRARSTRAENRVYPRVCGGARHRHRCSFQRQGLSPRVRGEPRPTVPMGRSSRVYPRVCGGARFCNSHSVSVSGLSPRVRGSRNVSEDEIGAVGSIPACAGEPPSPFRRPRATRVYPRVCGGALLRIVNVQADAGLSPRVRGSHIFHRSNCVTSGSIPACAGEPDCNYYFN